jgi:hypothetical protein
MTAMAVDSTGAIMPAGPTSAPTLLVARAVALGFVIAAALTAGGIALMGGGADWWHAFAAATIATLMASIVTIPIIAWGMRVAPARPELATGAFFASSAARAIISLGAAYLAVYRGGYPKTPTLLLVVPYYFALLGAETFVLVRLLWKSGAPQAGKSTEEKSTEEKHD